MTILLESMQPIDPENSRRLLILGGLGILAAIALLIVIAVVRKKYFPKEEQLDHAPAGFGVGDLKDLYDQGLISDDEYNAARAKIVAASHKAFMTAGKKEKADKK